MTGDQDDVLPQRSYFLQNFDAVFRAIADAVEVKNHGAKFGVVDEILDEVFGFGLHHPEIPAQSVLNGRKNLIIDGDQRN